MHFNHIIYLTLILFDTLAEAVVDAKLEGLKSKLILGFSGKIGKVRYKISK